MRFVFLFGFILLCRLVYGQMSTGEIYNMKPQYIIKTNPLAMLFGPMPVSAEYRLALETSTSQNQSLQIAFSYLGSNAVLKAVAEADTTLQYYNATVVLNGFRIQMSYRFYFFNDAPDGFYVAPHVSYSLGKMYLKQNGIKDDEAYSDITYVNYAGKIGFQKLINGDFVVDAFFGLGYRDNKTEFVYFPEDNEYVNGLKIYLGFNVGYAF